MTIAPLGQHTYDGCLIRALCVWGEVGEGGGGGGGGGGDVWKEEA